jgi:hypothetical protein
VKSTFDDEVAICDYYLGDLCIPSPLGGGDEIIYLSGERVYEGFWDGEATEGHGFNG